ncbi:MAG: glycosyltransferase [Planctomycetes bacterium]|nr:glycosyltransferase [Planctomycetota bacterium]
MKILILTPRYPFPPIGGDKLRICHISRFLAKRDHDLTLLSLVGGEDVEGRGEEVFSRIVTCVQTESMSYASSLVGLFSREPLQVAYFYSRKFQKLVDAELRGGAYDAVLCHFVRTAQFVRRRTAIPRVCEMTDAFSKYYEEVIRRRRRGVRNLLYRAIEFRRMRRYEREVGREFDRCVVVSHTDMEYIAAGDAGLRAKLAVIPNGVDCDRLRFYGGSYDDRLIVFMGNMRTLRNADACIHFVEDILPRVRRKMHGVRFKIIGAEPRREVRRLGERNGVTVTGRVNDIQSEACRAAVSVCPLRLGVGVQNKVLESMAMGVPVVSSQVGVEGLDVRPGRDLLVGRSPDEFAGHVLTLLRSPERRRRVATAARRRVEEDYSWEGRLAAYEQIFQDLQ